MSKKSEDKVLVAEQIFEVRHKPSGTFLDTRGYVADYIRDSGFLPHRKIDTNIVNFRDTNEGVNKEGAFIGYRNAGYISYDPPTRNYFIDRGILFWRTITNNKHYVIPEIDRFGARTKVFMPSQLAFEEINDRAYSTLYSDGFRKLLGGKETDVHFVVEIKENGFDIRLAGGPIHKDEAKRYFSFASDHFESTGLFLDIDYSVSTAVKHEDISRLLKNSVESAWIKIESIAGVIKV